MQIETDRPVMVTGATGYVAGWVVKRLLEAGVTVHAPVRDPKDQTKRAALDRIAATAPGRLRYFAADLLAPGSYAEAMAGCGVVLHTASPFVTQVKDPQRDLIAPAVAGTRTVLGTARETETVTRVVLTSSCAAIYTDARDTQDAPGGRIDETQWNTTASLAYQPYSYSKTLAERAAWEMAEAQDRWRLVTVNPSLVMGPAIGGAPTSESFRIMAGLGSGLYRAGAPRVGFGVVDVRDVAEAHLAAAFQPEAEGRYIVSAHETDLYEMLATLRAGFADRLGVPPRPLPKALVWLLAPMLGQSRRFIARNVHIPWRADNSKAIRDLGLRYRPLAETMEDMADYMLDKGLFAKR